MSNNLIMIIIIFMMLVFVPTTTVFLIIIFSKKSRERKIKNYTGTAEETITNIVKRGIDSPWIIYASYNVDGIHYNIKETAKLKSNIIKVGKIPIGQRKTFIMGFIKKGNKIKIQYDENNPKKAIIADNNGIITG
ncbi:hypothetical protein [Anaerofustis sp.]|uniref:hypothetical protein n=1 Tax=Anaerofustis sp. TaxID=1872517 RepID=UPI0025C66D35|nr:hypothetical protein [Anaerofustis sp.]